MFGPTGVKPLLPLTHCGASRLLKFGSDQICQVSTRGSAPPPGSKPPAYRRAAACANCPKAAALGRHVPYAAVLGRFGPSAQRGACVSEMSGESPCAAASRTAASTVVQSYAGSPGSAGCEGLVGARLAQPTTTSIVVASACRVRSSQVARTPGSGSAKTLSAIPVWKVAARTE